MSKTKYVRTAVVMVQLADVDEDPTSVDARVIGVKDRQVFYALQRYCSRMERKFGAALRSHLRMARQERRRLGLAEEIPLPLPSFDCGND